MPANPFKPTAGKNPPMLIGRDQVLEDFSEGIENGPGAPGRLMRISGARGMGKTVMLNALAAEARSRDWAVLEETASQGFCERLLAEAVPRTQVKKVSASPNVFGISFGGIDVERASLSLRDALGALAQKNGHGVLVTLDEVQDASLEEMRALSVAIQHVIREDGSVAFAFAGLPSMIESVVNGKTLTFLRRALPVELGPVSIVEVAVSLKSTMADSGMDIGSDTCRYLAEASHGYPFMVQLVGYYSWQVASNRRLTTVDRMTAEEGVAIARDRFDATVIEPALQRVSNAQLAYLLAMAEDGEGPSSTSVVAHRLGKTPQQVTPYRARLLSEDVIEAPVRGKVSFAIPCLSEYLNGNRERIEAELADGA